MLETIIFIILAILAIGIVLWAIDTFIAPIPQNIKIAVAVIVLLMLVLYVAQSGKLHL